MRGWGPMRRSSLARRDDVDERREKTLPEFLELMDDYRPVVRPRARTNEGRREGRNEDERGREGARARGAAQAWPGTVEAQRNS